jgi:hypothetical protein
MKRAALIVATCLLPAISAAATFEEQVEAYLRDYPSRQTYEYALRFTGGDPARLNAWAIPGEPKLVSAGEDVVPRTNHDTFYQMAFLWLGDGPVVLASLAPAAGRFFSFQLIDERNENYRNVLHPAGEYTLYSGERPAGIRGEAIESPSPLSIVIVRVEVKDERAPDDVAAARAVMEGITVSGGRPREFPPRRGLPDAFTPEVVAEAERRMDEVFRTVPYTLLVVGPGQEPGVDLPYLHHAAGTRGGFGGPDPRHSAYEAIFVDAKGRELRGANGEYAVTTAVPPVDAFWSVTVYDTDRGGFLHPNGNDRYHVNDSSARRNPDGTITFRFRQDCEPAAANCLDVPPGRFEVVTRYYLPQAEIISGSWKFPPIELKSQ